MAALAVDPPRDERLLTSRAQFLSSLSARLTALHEALTELSAGGSGPAQHGVLLRRLRAMADASAMLGFEEMSNAFTVGSDVLAQVVDGNLEPRAAQEIRSLLDLIPSLIPDSMGDDTEASASDEALRAAGPLTLVCLVSPGQSLLLHRVVTRAENIQLVLASTPAELASQVASFEPDWVIIDGRRLDAAEAVARFRMRACLVVDVPDHATARMRAAGARVVSLEGTPLRQSLAEALRVPGARASEIVPKPQGATIARVVETAVQDFRESLLVGLSAHESQQLLTPNTQSALEALTWSAISKMREVIAEASGGVIQYPERAPEGALLVTGKAALRHARHPTADSSNLKGRRVLIADDDPAIAWFLGSVLRAAGAEVLEAKDGLEALRIARRELPDLVISDVMMPELDGFALCRNLKRDVLLSDVPVILLSWKEDLLQRVRELGVGAAGYLPKETEATTIVDRCCEAVEPRVRIERRLREGQIVHGRLDGVTPRLVLELACRTLDNARVTFQDAAFSYEVWVGDGRILAASRGSKDSPSERGSLVLSGLLGMRAGRFVVEPTETPVQAELFGSLSKVIAPHVERIRRALAQLQGTRVYDVQRLDLDYAAVAPYLASSPTIMSKLVERLVQGVAPSTLLQQVSASLLESVLVDLALRGSVLAAWDSNGEDLLSVGHEPAEAFDVDLAPARPGAVVQPAAGAPKIGAHSTATDSEAAALFAERALASGFTDAAAAVGKGSGTRRAVNPDAEVSPQLIAGDEQRFSVAMFEARPALPLEEDVITPDFARVAERPATQTIPVPAPDASEPHWAASLGAEMNAETGFDLFDAVSETPGSASSAMHILSLSERRAAFLDLDDADAESAPPGAAAEDEGTPRARDVDLARAPVAAARTIQRPTLTGLGFPSPPRKLDWREFIGDGSADAAVIEGGASPFEAAALGAPSALDALDSLFGEPEASPGIVPVHTQPAAKAAAQPFATSFEHIARPRQATDVASVKAEAAEPSSSVSASAVPPSVESESAEPPSAELREVEPGDADAASGDAPTVETASVARAAVPPKPAVVAVSVVAAAPNAADEDPEKTRPPVGVRAPSASEAPGERVKSRPNVSRFARGLLPAAIVLGTGGLVFGVSTMAWRVLGTQPQGAVQVNDPALGANMGQQAVALSPANKGTPAAAADKPEGDRAEEDDLRPEPGRAGAVRVVALKSVLLALPENIQVAPDSGLLEVSSDGRQKIYVNDVFVGRGPLRRVPLKPGPYSVTLRLDGAEQSYPATVVVGKRTRLEPVSPTAP